MRPALKEEGGAPQKIVWSAASGARYESGRDRQEQDGNRRQDEQKTRRNPQQSEIFHEFVLDKVELCAEGTEKEG